ncbi:hypothetical protein QMK19_26570 [Streptomyces sp. H10-C2]|uniref:hypothetical protein n=1 Tax=unclassified Streptomyces TaxID=2593676 RepID=UPI0024BAA292|nr:MULTISPECIES: hypothetical protein [unclassified Streptomyces]MDJ0343625.1 hypothetical protein [Streptomyces sp. PH10-H1]MDJ0373127.1 hypothetical protein [Streptomyces sp. H10-C2]
MKKRSMLAIASLAVGVVTALVTPGAHADIQPSGGHHQSDASNDETDILNDAGLGNTQINSDSVTMHG